MGLFFGILSVNISLSCLIESLEQLFVPDVFSLLLIHVLLVIFIEDGVILVFIVLTWLLIGQIGVVLVSLTEFSFLLKVDDF